MFIFKTIKHRMAILLLLLMMGTSIIGGYSIYIQKDMRIKYEHFLQYTEVATHLKNFQYKLAGISNDERGFLVKKDVSYVEQIDEKQKEALELLEKSKVLIVKEEQQLVVNLEKAFASYIQAHEDSITAYEDGNLQLAEEIHFINQRTIRKETLSPAIEELVASIDTEVHESKVKLAALETKRTTSQIVLILSIILLSLTVGILLTRSIIQPLKEMNIQFKEIASGNGDLTKEIKIRTNDELGELASSFNQFLSTLRTIIINVEQHSNSVASSSVQLQSGAESVINDVEAINQSIQQLTHTVETQNIMSNESATAVEETSKGISSIAENASSVSELSHTASIKANEGTVAINELVAHIQSLRTEVNETAHNIQSLGERSKEIGKITTMIQEISEQTNLLALNAAIEAARAGESGRGFAVVADEVRKLAEQSSHSTKQISTLIQQVQAETHDTIQAIETTKQIVSDGVHSAEQTNEKFNEILNAMEEMKVEIENISATSEQISAGSQQVAASVQEMAHASTSSFQMTKQVAASSDRQMTSIEYMNKTATSLSTLAGELQELIKRFKVQ
ncbi:methyl-accepting chemotaxis protein [Metabacillus iocasae]|uniref:Methyl-accepting chemotaxis protein n=1 Tax=Priestia iocasae TaxID=2291674 RepID=A0ABS2QYI2_9BACI|nr:HAMP domain-containing methyl-accepting chemotaxis protein [Metabacillus iocasae]MBM7704535.1 methyl-accepting chemotaxis protein [Metabacillus iocasae]